MSLRFPCMLMHFFILSIAFSLLVRVLAMDTDGGGGEDMELSVSHSIGLRSNAKMLFGHGRRIAQLFVDF